MFSQISKNWRGRPLLTMEIIVNLIAATTTQKGLKIKCQSDLNVYERGKKVSDEEINKVRINRESFQGVWNYSIEPEHAQV
jgi:hypothetical protein